MAGFEPLSMLKIIGYFNRGGHHYCIFLFEFSALDLTVRIPVDLACGGDFAVHIVFELTDKG